MTPTEKFLSLFTKIRPGEGRSIVLLGLNGFLLVCAYYTLKTLRESLILTEYDAETKSYAVVVTALVLLFVIPIYGILFRRSDRTQLVVTINVFFIINLVIFYLMQKMGVNIAFPYYVWIGIFGVMVVAQFWAHATDIYNVRSGQRVFPIIMVATSIGGLVGSQFAAAAFPVLHSSGLMLVAGVLLAISVFLYRPVQSMAPRDSRSIECEYVKPKYQGIFGGFAIVTSDHYLRLIALFVILLNWINSTGEYILSEMVVQWAKTPNPSGLAGYGTDALIAWFYGNFNFWVTLSGLILQTFFVARILRFFGMPKSLMILPIVSAIGYALIAFIPIFSIIRLVKITENAIDYSLVSTIRQALFLPTSREMKYEGKTAIDTFFWRFGDLIQGGTIYLGIHVYGFGIAQFAMVNLLLGLVWIGIAMLMAREYCRVVSINATSQPPQLNVPIPDVTLNRGEFLDIKLDPETFYDPDPGDVITLRASLVNGNRLPSWLKFQPASGRFRGTPPGNIQELALKVTASDFELLTASDTFTIRFSAVPPEIDGNLKPG